MSVCISQAISTPLMIDENLSCPQCPKMFSSTKLLQQHQQMFHTDKAFICETCGKAFRFRSNLAEHRSVHTALKPYVCKFCGKSSRLKGNLTKHILKHHKKEQNEAIGKDDIIVKKDNGPLISATPSSSSTPTVLNNIHNNNNIKIEIDDSSLFNVSTSSAVSTVNNGENTEPSLIPRDLTSEQERSIFISLGLDYTNSLDLRDTPETSVSPDNVMSKIDIDSDAGYESPLAQNTVGGETSLAALIAHVGSGESPPPSDSSKLQVGTQCPECGKHVRKSSHLPVHMSIHHGFPPESAMGFDEKTFEDYQADDNLQGELKAIANAICELKAQQLTTPKIEQLLGAIDARVSRLEKNMDMALNSIYTLVQLQTGMNSNVNRFKEDAAGKLEDIKFILERTGTSD